MIFRVVNGKKILMADVSKQPDWNQTNEKAKDFIKNKPDVLTAEDLDNPDGRIYEKYAQKTHEHSDLEQLIGEIEDDYKNHSHNEDHLAPANHDHDTVYSKLNHSHFGNELLIDNSEQKSIKDYIDSKSNEIDKKLEDIVQSDWNQNDSNAIDFIKNKPDFVAESKIQPADLSNQRAYFGQKVQNGTKVTYARSDHYHELPIATSQEVYPLQRPAIVVSGTIQINNTANLGFPINLSRIGNTVTIYGGMTGDNSLGTGAHICYIPVGFRPDPNDQYAYNEYIIANAAGGGQTVTTVKLRYVENRIPEQQWELYLAKGNISKSSPLGLYMTWTTVEPDPLRPPLEPEPVWPFGVIVPSLDIAYSIDKSCRHIGMHVTVQNDKSWFNCPRVYWFKNGIEDEDLIPRYYSGMVVPNLQTALETEMSSRHIGMHIVIQNDNTWYKNPRVYWFKDGIEDENLIPKYDSGITVPNLEEAYLIDMSSRYIGMKIIIENDGTGYGGPREYWFRDGIKNEDLIPYLKYIEDDLAELFRRVRILEEEFRGRVDLGTYDIPTQPIV